LCGAYTILTFADKEEIRRFLQEIEERLGDSYKKDVRPTDPAPALIAGEDGLLTCELMRFGFPGYKGSQTIINARSETISEKVTFREAIANRRCVLPAAGFFEWSGSKAPKTKHHITLADSSEMYLAGCYSVFNTPGGEERRFVIVTTEPTPQLAAIHNRMPVTLHPDEVQSWLTADYRQLYNRQGIRFTIEPEFQPVDQQIILQN